MRATFWFLGIAVRTARALVARFRLAKAVAPPAARFFSGELLGRLQVVARGLSSGYTGTFCADCKADDHPQGRCPRCRAAMAAAIAAGGGGRPK